MHSKGWKVASIFDTVEKGLGEQANLDVDSVATSDLLEEVDNNERGSERIMYIFPIIDGDDEESEYKDEDGKFSMYSMKSRLDKLT